MTGKTRAQVRLPWTMAQVAITQQNVNARLAMRLTDFGIRYNVARRLRARLLFAGV